MEELKILAELFEFKQPDYYASFDPMTGQVQKVGPESAFIDIPNKIKIDIDIVEAIHLGNLKLSSCFVSDSNTLEIAEKKSLTKIDDVLHKIKLKQYASTKQFDIYLTFNKKNKNLKIELSKELGGTKTTKSKSNRKIIWSGDTEIVLIISNYNDPHWIIQTICVKIQDLIGRSYTVECENIKDDFSIYTRRLFKNYILEIK